MYVIACQYSAMKSSQVQIQVPPQLPWQPMLLTLKLWQNIPGLQDWTDMKMYIKQMNRQFQSTKIYNLVHFPY